MKRRKRSIFASKSQKDAAERQTQRQLQCSPDGESWEGGLPLFESVYFEKGICDEFDRIWKKVKEKGPVDLTDDERRTYDMVLSAIGTREKFDYEFFKECYPRKNDFPGLYHPGIRATPHGIVIPAEITTKEYREYFPQINALLKKYFPDRERLKRGPMKGSGDRMSSNLRRQIWSNFVRLVAGDDVARKSATLNLESLKDLPKKMNWGKVDKILSKKFHLPIWKIQHATGRR